MKRLTTLLAMGVFGLFLAGVAQATQYPPGPGGTCTDTLTLYDVRVQPAGACQPASGDTVYGIKGIVTGFDKDFSPYGFFIQMAGSGSWKGTQVFTGATNYFNSVPSSPTGGNLQLGDQIIMYGRRLEFRDGTELTDFDNIQGTDDIIVRRDTPTNVGVPDYYVGDVHQFNWVPGLSGVLAEQWEGMLVKIRGPLTVGRIAGAGVGSRSMLIASASFPGDTAAIDGFTLSNIPALTVGTPIDSVQGILYQTQINSISSYRILMRNSGDLFAAAPPNVVEAYPIADNQLRVLFDRPLDPTDAVMTLHYTLSDLGSVDTATLEAGNQNVVLGITPNNPRGVSTTLTVTGVKSSSGLPMPGSQNRTFIMGVLKLSEVQYADDAGLLEVPCHDRTRYSTPTGGNGTRLTYMGTVVGKFGTSLYYLSDGETNPDSLRGGMSVYAPPAPLTIGNKYMIAGQVQEFDGIGAQIAAGETEGAPSVYVKDLGAGTIPPPRVKTIATLSDTTCDTARNLVTGEDYEGMLVQLQAVVTTENRTAGQSFFVAGPNPYWSSTADRSGRGAATARVTAAYGDTLLISNSNDAYSFASDSAYYVTVTGVMSFRNASTHPYRLLPRSDADIQVLGPVGVTLVEPLELSFAVSPNPSTTPTLSFTLPTAEKVELSVFDLAGRRVADVLRGQLPAGRYQREWNRRADNGGTVGAGMYFFRLRVGDQTRFQRAVLLK